MEALLTLLFFVLLWGAPGILKLLGRASPELRRLSDSLCRGEGRAPEPEQTPGSPASGPSAFGPPVSGPPACDSGTGASPLPHPHNRNHLQQPARHERHPR